MPRASERKPKETHYQRNLKDTHCKGKSDLLHSLAYLKVAWGGHWSTCRSSKRQRRGGAVNKTSEDGARIGRDFARWRAHLPLLLLPTAACRKLDDAPAAHLSACSAPSRRARERQTSGHCRRQGARGGWKKKETILNCFRAKKNKNNTQKILLGPLGPLGLERKSNSTATAVVLYTITISAAAAGPLAPPGPSGPRGPKGPTGPRARAPRRRGFAGTC